MVIENASMAFFMYSKEPEKTCIYISSTAINSLQFRFISVLLIGSENFQPETGRTLLKITLA